MGGVLPNFKSTKSYKLLPVRDIKHSKIVELDV